MGTATNAAQARTPTPQAVAAILDPRARDVVIIVGVLAAEVLAMARPWHGGDRDFGVGAGVLIGVSVLVLWWRRSHPIAVTLFASAVALALPVTGNPGGPHVAVLVGVFSVGLYESSRHRSQGVALLVATLGALHGLLEGFDRNLAIEQLLVGFTVPAVVWFAADRIRGRNDYLSLLEDRAQRSQREKQTEKERAVAEERARIARELHDVVAHRVSMMTVQANAARMVVASDAQRAELSMQSVTDAGKQAMSELRTLVDVLRPESDGQPEAPQPGLDDIDALIGGVADTGLAVTCQVTGDPQPLPTAVGLSTYRIVQEALTNALKHAGPTASVQVTIDHSPDEIVIIVVDNGHGALTSNRRAAPVGHGIIGMKERVALFGGHLEAGPRADRGFRVAATIPTSGYRR